MKIERCTKLIVSFTYRFSSTWDTGTPNELWNHALKIQNPKNLSKSENKKGTKPQYHR
jgi:hypothetical protein